MTHPQNTKAWEKASDADLAPLIETELQYEPFECDIVPINYIGYENANKQVPVYIKDIPTSPCIHIRIGLRYGAMHDDLGKEGTAHFLEHMLFDGSSMFADEKETQEFGKVIMLDSLNAYTSFLELFVTGKCLSHNFELAVQGIMSIVMEPKLTEKSFMHEQKVITQEAWGRFLNEKRLAYIRKERENRLYDLPDRLRLASALGWPETILALTLEDIKKAHATYFIADNLEIYVAGNISSVGGKEKLIKLFESYVARMRTGKPSALPTIPAQIGNPRVKVFDHTYEEIGLAPREQASISLTALAPRIGKSADKENSELEIAHLAALYMAGELLTDLVFRKLRLENSWCYGAGANSSTHIDNLSLNMSSTIDYHHVDEALDILKQLIESIKNGEFVDDFYKTKKLIIENSIARERTT